jgi:hypothetical protein
MQMSRREIEANALPLAGDLRWMRRMLCCLLANKVVEQSRDVTVKEFEMEL